MSQPNQIDPAQIQNQFNQLYTQYQNAVRQLQLYEQQESQVESVIGEMLTNIQTLSGLDNFEEDNEIIIPLGGMILLKANLAGIKEVLVDIGSNVMVPSTLEKAEKMLNSRLEELKDLLGRIKTDKQNLEGIASTLQAQLNQFS